MNPLNIIFFFAAFYSLTGLFLWLVEPKQRPDKDELTDLRDRVRQAEMDDYNRQIGRRKPMRWEGR